MVVSEQQPEAVSSTPFINGWVLLVRRTILTTDQEAVRASSPSLPGFARRALTSLASEPAKGADRPANLLFPIRSGWPLSKQALDFRAAKQRAQRHTVSCPYSAAEALQWDSSRKVGVQRGEPGQSSGRHGLEERVSPGKTRAEAHKGNELISMTNYETYVPYCQARQSPVKSRQIRRTFGEVTQWSGRSSFFD